MFIALKHPVVYKLEFHGWGFATKEVYNIRSHLSDHWRPENVSFVLCFKVLKDYISVI